VLGEILTAICTPFKADGAVDYQAFRALAAHLVANGSDGLVVTGTTGESPTLSDEERFGLYEAALEEVGDRATVVAGTGTYSTEHSVHLTARAHELGVHGFLVVTPYYSKPPQRAIVRHFQEIAAATLGEGVTVTIKAPHDLTAVADRMVLDRVVSNLLANAERHGAPPVTLTAEQRDGHLHVAVSDHGPGVPEELRPRLFDRFARGDDGRGSGLGLAIARAYARAHGGDIEYQPGNDGGARFELILPQA